jgi:hypothetical protein
MAEQQPKAQTAEELEQGAMNRLPMLQRMMGEDVTKPYAEELKAKRAALPEQMEKDTGLAMAMAGFKMLGAKGSNRRAKLIQGISDAGESFTSEVSRLKKENREADDKLRQSELLIATAQQQRKEGMATKALASEEKADDKRQEAFRTKLAVQEKATQLLSAQATTEAQGENALRVAGANAASHLQAAKITAAKETDLNRQTNIRYAALIEQGKPANKQTMAEAASMAANDLKQSDVRREAAAGVRDDKFEARVDKALESNMPYMKAVQKGKTDEAARIRQGVVEELRATASQSAPAPTAAPAAVPQAAAPTAKPSLQAFMDAARKANPGVSDADLAAYYNSKYAK